MKLLILGKRLDHDVIVASPGQPCGQHTRPVGRYHLPVGDPVEIQLQWKDFLLYLVTCAGNITVALVNGTLCLYYGDIFLKRKL